MSPQIHTSSDQVAPPTSVARAGSPFPFFLASILSVALAIRIPRLFESIWFDELWSTRIMLDSVLELGKVWIYDCHPPFHPTLMFFWIRLFGDSEVSVRLPPLIFGLASIGVAYQLAARWWDKPTARITAILMCFSPVHIWYSCEARQYATTIFLIITWTYVFDRIVILGLTPRRRLLYGAVVIAAVFTHFFNACFLIIFALAAWRYHPSLRPFVLRTHLLCAVLLSVLIGSKFVIGSLQSEADHLRPFDLEEAYHLFSSWFATGNVYEVWGAQSSVAIHLHVLTVAIAISLFFLALVGVWDIARKTAPCIAYPFICLLFGLPVALLVLSQYSPGGIYVERSLLAVFAFYCMALARGILAFNSHSVVATATLAGFMVITFAIFVWQDDQWTVYKQKADWRSASQVIAATTDKEGKQRLFTVRPAKELTYYLPQAAEFRELGSIVHARRERFRKMGQSMPFISKFFEEAAQHVMKKMEDRIASATILIQVAEADVLCNFLDDRDNSRCTIVRNEYWLGRTDELIYAVEHHPEWEIVEAGSYKGLRVFECHRRSASE